MGSCWTTWYSPSHDHEADWKKGAPTRLRPKKREEYLIDDSYSKTTAKEILELEWGVRDSPKRWRKEPEYG